MSLVTLTLTLTVAVAILASLPGGAEAQDCTYAVPSVGASYDLSALRMDAGSAYTAEDELDAEDRAFRYTYNVCGLVDAPLGNCSGTSPAWQVWEEGGRCWRLGPEALTHADALSWSLIGTDPTNGIQLIYRDGERCETSPDKNRSITINVVCKNTQDVPDLVVSEPDECSYAVEHHSIFGCPRECGINNAQLCNGNGHCEFDPVANAPRCLCNEGYVGVSCEAEPLFHRRRACDGTCGAMIFVLVILVAFIVLAATALYKNHKRSALVASQNSEYSARLVSGGDGTADGGDVDIDETPYGDGTSVEVLGDEV